MSFFLIFRLWWPFLIFLHLYFGPCIRDVSIYFLTLCACIVHDVCIYTCSPIPMWLSQSMSPKAKWCLISAMKVRWHVAGFSLWKSGTRLECHRKASIGTMPFQNPNLKAPCMQSPESQFRNHVFTTNFWKLRFYQNKGLPLDKRCGCLTPSPHVTKLSDLRIKIFFHPH